MAAQWQVCLWDSCGPCGPVWDLWLCSGRYACGTVAGLVDQSGGHGFAAAGMLVGLLRALWASLVLMTLQWQV